MTVKEPVVGASTPMPHGYVFVPTGNMYVTRTCRSWTQLGRQTVFVVVDDKRKRLGIRVPSTVYSKACSSELATRRHRTTIVKKIDNALESQYEDAILEAFPKIPKQLIPDIVRVATAKHSGRIGRTGTLDMAQKARLGVRAHIRHNHTDYDRLLKGKDIGRNQARQLTSAKTNDVMRQWGCVSINPKPKANSTVKAPCRSRRGPIKTKRSSSGVRPSRTTLSGAIVKRSPVQKSAVKKGPVTKPPLKKPPPTKQLVKVTQPAKQSSQQVAQVELSKAAMAQVAAAPNQPCASISDTSTHGTLPQSLQGVNYLLSNVPTRPRSAFRTPGVPPTDECYSNDSGLQFTAIEAKPHVEATTPIAAPQAPRLTRLTIPKAVHCEMRFDVDKPNMQTPPLGHGQKKIRSDAYRAARKRYRQRRSSRKGLRREMEELIREASLARLEEKASSSMI